MRKLIPFKRYYYFTKFLFISTKHFEQVSLHNKEMVVFTSREKRKEGRIGNGMECMCLFRMRSGEIYNN
jgi:hypothetical protein